ncbi:ATP-dependent acyl-CoA ligase [Pseudooceanicola sp. HF7]|uniref:ATP-dependent acyl-CoA ligase n=1 Tax=Pseudooceanicola sp. HF7 TaxID=2721560 RepID=UPI001C37AE47
MTVIDSVEALKQTFPPETRSLPGMLTQQAQAHPDRRLAVFRQESWTCADAMRIAAQTAGALAAAGIKRGDRVAILAGNRPEFLRLLLGCGWLGAIAVPVNTATRGMQFEHILKTSGACLLVIEKDLLPALDTVTAPDLKSIWVIDGEETDGIRQPLPEGGEALPAADVQPSETLLILFTSGTTGPSKGVCCPHAQFFWWGYHTAALLGVTADDVLLTSLPLFHTNAMNTCFQALLTGATVVIEPRFSVSNYFAALDKHKATVTYLLGAMVPMLMARAEGPETRTHRCRIALAPATPGDMFDSFRERFGIGLVDGYGATETNFVIGATPDEQRNGMMGKLRPGFEARVVDENDQPVPPGEAGELLLRADEANAFSTGYFGMPEKTVEAWQNLWFHSGDRVVQEPDGYFRFLDRMKDAIRRRGENISSFEVEQVLVSHPDVANAAAFPVRSELAEDEVMAAVVLKPGKSLTPEALLDHCTPRMPYFAVPRFLDFVEALPTTANGKVTKFPLREQGVGPQTWDRDKAGYVVARNGAPARPKVAG